MKTDQISDAAVRSSSKLSKRYPRSSRFNRGNNAKLRWCWRLGDAKSGEYGGWRRICAPSYISVVSFWVLWSVRRRVVLLKYDIFRVLSSSSRHGAGHSVAPKINTHVLVVLDTYGVVVFNLNLIYCRYKNTYMTWSWNFLNILPLNNIQYLLFWSSYCMT